MVLDEEEQAVEVVIDVDADAVDEDEDVIVVDDAEEASDVEEVPVLSAPVLVTFSNLPKVNVRKLSSVTVIQRS